MKPDTSPTIDEIINKKRILEDTICNLISDFMEETGVNVKYIDIKVFEQLSVSGKLYREVDHVELDVSF